MPTVTINMRDNVFCNACERSLKKNAMYKFAISNRIASPHYLHTIHVTAVNLMHNPSPTSMQKAQETRQ